jgi:Flp pilus assembly pilin Flp
MHLTTTAPDPEPDQRGTGASHADHADPATRITSGSAHPTSAEAQPTRRRHLHVLHDDDGSLVTEYGLLAVVAATIAGVVIQWASGGALVTLFNALLRQARSLVGA